MGQGSPRKPRSLSARQLGPPPCPRLQTRKKHPESPAAALRRVPSALLRVCTAQPASRTGSREGSCGQCCHHHPPTWDGGRIRTQARLKPYDHTLCWPIVSTDWQQINEKAAGGYSLDSRDCLLLWVAGDIRKAGKGRSGSFYTHGSSQGLMLHGKGIQAPEARAPKLRDSCSALARRGWEAHSAPGRPR